MNWRRAFIVFLCAVSAGAGRAQPIVLSPAEAARQGPELAAQIIAAARPYESTTNLAAIEITRKRQKQLTPVRFQTQVGGNQWTFIYETLTQTNSAKLRVTRSPGAQSEYRLEEAQKPEPRVLEGNAAMVPFAGSDFWVVDLGLQFLDWPQQRLLRKEIRRGQSCAVLESINPNPAPGAYSRVLSWVEIDSRGIINAEAFEGDRLLKKFAASSFKKIDGQWELTEMVMEDRRTHSVTRIEFDLGS
jgi:hypothetical protein